ncbi:hypothetical protein BD413DRAFT_435882, partial [Trametes elegans]
PPGPRPLPVLGNLLDFPKFKPWVGFRTMRDLIYLQVPRQRILVIGSAKVATEFLEKRSANSSDRPHNIVFDL